MSLGTPKELRDPAAVQEPTTLSLETWGSTLVLVRNTEKAVDFAPIGQVTEESRRLDLVLYIDEKKFEVVACAPAGKVLGRLSDNAQAKESGRPMIKLVNTNNKGGTLRLERLNVREWNGRLPSQTNAVGAGIACIDEQFYQGTVTEFNATDQSFQLAGPIRRPRVYRSTRSKEFSSMQKQRTCQLSTKAWKFKPSMEVVVSESGRASVTMAFS